MSKRAAAVAVWLWLVMIAGVCKKVGSQIGEESSTSTMGDEHCLYEKKESCVKAEEAGCIWCDLPRRCYSAARSLELGEFCSRKKVKPFVDVPTCDEIVQRQNCSGEVNCRWCKSQALDDGCFGAIEAARLPKHIFVCPATSSGSAISTAIGI